MEGCDGEGRSPYHTPKELQSTRDAECSGQPEAMSCSAVLYQRSWLYV